MVRSMTPFGNGSTGRSRRISAKGADCAAIVIDDARLCAQEYSREAGIAGGEGKRHPQGSPSGRAAGRFPLRRLRRCRMVEALRPDRWRCAGHPRCSPRTDLPHRLPAIENPIPSHTHGDPATCSMANAGIVIGQPPQCVDQGGRMSPCAQPGERPGHPAEHSCEADAASKFLDRGAQLRIIADNHRSANHRERVGARFGQISRHPNRPKKSNAIPRSPSASYRA